MAKGNRIILTPDRGYSIEGSIASGETVYPGMVLQFDPTVTAIGGRYTLKIYNRDADGDRPLGPFCVVKEDFGQGKTTADAYSTTAGTRVFAFVPNPGCELNLLFKNVSGTADDVLAGDIFIVDDGTGKVIVTTGTVEAEVAAALEAVTDPTADTLVHSIWSGY